MNKTDFEHALPALFNDALSRRTAARAMLELKGLNPTEALIADEAFEEVAKGMATLIGRIVDGVAPDNGLQLMVLKHLTRGALHVSRELDAIVERMAGEEFILEGKAHITPDCDCDVCKLAAQVNNSLEQAELVMAQTKH